MDKQTLLKRYRARKRILLAVIALTGIALAYFASVWIVLPYLVLCWVGHEAWFSDHLFYRVDQDHEYRFGEHLKVPLTLGRGILQAPAGTLLKDDTYVLEITVVSNWSSWFRDPQLIIGNERFDFEHRACGKRYLLLSLGEAERANGQIPVCTKSCRITDTAQLLAFSNPDYSQQRMMIVAPHADDAELAAFALYQGHPDTTIVTVTQGETETDEFEAIGLSKREAGHLKGRLRSWDSIVIPMWAGVRAENCVQLGYFGMRLQAMRADADTPFRSLSSDDSDVRAARCWNRRGLPSDKDGQPTWSNLVADLRDLIETYRPEVIVTPHPRLDPHPDHVAATAALKEAVAQTRWMPQSYLLYANHLRDNDRWPMGPVGGGITLPPTFGEFETESCFHQVVSSEIQIDKAMALGMHHDLRPCLPIKKRLRRIIQSVLAGRRWPATGDNEFFRKAVRSSELFFVCSSLERLP